MSLVPIKGGTGADNKSHALSLSPPFTPHMCGLGAGIPTRSGHPEGAGFGGEAGGNP